MGFWEKFRPNLLIVIVVAYAAVVGIFCLMLWNGVDAKTAFDLVSTPFIALIGGTLAIAKDLI